MLKASSCILLKPLYFHYPSSIICKCPFCSFQSILFCFCQRSFSFSLCLFLSPFRCCSDSFFLFSFECSSLFLFSFFQLIIQPFLSLSFPLALSVLSLCLFPEATRCPRSSFSAFHSFLDRPFRPNQRLSHCSRPHLASSDISHKSVIIAMDRTPTSAGLRLLNEVSYKIDFLVRAQMKRKSAAAASESICFLLQYQSCITSL